MEKTEAIPNKASRKLNVVLVITDDQGYGDLSCHGNPWLKTPNLDEFHRQSVRFSDFHVSPLCAPTRGALMTGHRPCRNGCWATEWGRSIAHADEVMMPEVFRQNGYRTAMFGKWHIGDNYPYRPQDRGFERVVAHKGSGVGALPDFWGNNYFDDTYFYNGKPVKHDGYCTDVWFEQAMKFIGEVKDEPFFVYLSTNAPHFPFLVAERYEEPYRGIEEIYSSAFCGMVANIDENFGKLKAFMRDNELWENTILIFMTDNGTFGGYNDRQGAEMRGYNAGMKGRKASYHEGGHRVPFFIHCPALGIEGGIDIDDMSAHIDVLPTLIDLCGLTQAEDREFDGISLKPRIMGEMEQLADRVHFVQYHQGPDKPNETTYAALTNRWRFVCDTELYDIKADPGQKNNVDEQHPEVVKELRDAHRRWWKQMQPYMDRKLPIHLGNDAENPTRLDSHDIQGDICWNQIQIIEALKTSGYWWVNVEQEGKYRISLRRWPDELNYPIDEVWEPKTVEESPTPYFVYEKPVPDYITFAAGRIVPIKARVKIFDREEFLPVNKGDKEVTFHMHLTQGVTQLEAEFIDVDGQSYGAWYVYVERLDSAK